jgi:hypothetical protein
MLSLREGAGRALAAAAIAAVICTVAAPPAPAATQIGQTINPADPCTGVSTLVQAGSPGFSYLAPQDGVITSWSFQADATPPQVKLKLLRQLAGATFTVVGESGAEIPAPSVASSFSTRVSVRRGDALGLTVLSNGDCATNGVAGHGLCVQPGDFPPGSTVTFGFCGVSQLDVSAILEPDADNDGFGDETQDQCTGLGGATNGCPPNTTITQRPKDKTKKKTATFAFTAGPALAARQAVTFQCKLDSGPFEPCTSPKTYKVKRGRHTFQVQATLDGFTDSTPATDSWKRKKKK